jgi:Uma2 family endonuclease
MRRKDETGEVDVGAAQPLPGTLIDPLYPSEDTENVGESGFQHVARTWLWEALQEYFARKGNVFVASDLFWYWEKGNPSACSAPDVMVVKGVSTHTRRSFRQWEEAARPCVMFEMASEKTWRQDVGEKKSLYEEIAVPEYFIFDPEGVFLQPVLRGYRLRGGKYVALREAKDGSLESKELGLRLTPEGSMLRPRNLKTGRKLLTLAEVAQRALNKLRHAEQSAGQVKALKAENARLRALLNLPPEG